MPKFVVSQTKMNLLISVVGKAPSLDTSVHNVLEKVVATIHPMEGARK